MPRAESNCARAGARPGARVTGNLSCLAATVFLLLSNLSPATAQPAWTGVLTTVSNETAPGLKFVGDAAGNAIAMWAPGAGAIKVVHFNATTRAWSAPVMLLPGGSYDPRMVMNRVGDAVVVWSEQDASGRRIRSARYSSTTGAWGGPVVIVASTTLTFNSPDVALDPNGNAIATWQTLGASSTSQVQTASYSVAAGAWSAPVNVTPLASNSSLTAQPRVVIDASGNATLAFWSGPLGTRALYASRASAGGGPWSNPQALRVANGSSGSVLAVDGSGNVLVVWEGLAARYTAATSTWSSVWTLFTGSVGEAQLVVDDVGDATVMWFGYQSQGYVAYSIGYSALSDTWSTPRQMSTAAAGGSPCLAVDGAGTVTASWAEAGDNVTGATAYAARRVRGQPWATKIALRDGGSACAAEASDAGEVTVLWSDLKATRWSLTGAEAIAAPTGLHATTSWIFNHEAEIGAPIRVSWSPPSTGLPVTGYRLEAGTGPDLRNLAEVDVGAATQLNATVPAVRRIVLRVRAVSGATVGPPSSEFVFLVFGACPPIETTPTGLAQSVLGNIVTLSWQLAQGAGSYVLEAGSAPGLADLVSANIGGARQYTTVAPPGTYYVRVRGANNCNVGAPSNEVVVTVAGATAPGAPSLHAPTVNGHTVSLSWSPGSGSAPANYTLTASKTPGGAPVATIGLTSTTASFADVPSGTYYLRLTASNAGGTGPPSAQVSVTVP